MYEAPNDLGAIISRVCPHFFLPFSTQVNTDLPVFHVLLTMVRTHTHTYGGTFPSRLSPSRYFTA